MGRVHIAGMENQPKFDAKTFDPWKTATKKGEGISFIDVWLAESPDPRNHEEVADSSDEVAHLVKLASGSDLYHGFEEELAEIKGQSYDEVLRKQDDIELTQDTFSAAPKAARPTFFPDF